MAADSTDDVMLQEPPVAVADPTWVAPAYNLTVEPASAVPLNVGVVSDVRLSVELKPVSDASSRSSVGGKGAVVSTMMWYVLVTVVAGVVPSVES